MLSSSTMSDPFLVGGPSDFSHHSSVAQRRTVELGPQLTIQKPARATPVTLPAQHGVYRSDGAPGPSTASSFSARRLAAMPRIAIFEGEYSSRSIEKARNRTVEIVSERHKLGAHEDSMAPLPPRDMDPKARKEKAYIRKLDQNRKSAEISRDRNRVYVSELERELENMEKLRDTAQDELLALQAQVWEMTRTRIRAEVEGLVDGTGPSTAYASQPADLGQQRHQLPQPAQQSSATSPFAPQTPVPAAGVQPLSTPTPLDVEPLQGAETADPHQLGQQMLAKLDETLSKYGSLDFSSFLTQRQEGDGVPEFGDVEWTRPAA